jgi:SAM-dependent methyltransferase
VFGDEVDIIEGHRRGRELLRHHCDLLDETCRATGRHPHGALGHLAGEKHRAPGGRVLAATVLCFVPDAGLAVREMARVLAPGGRLVLGELGRFSLWAAERRVRGWFGAGTWRRAQFWSRAELAELARNAGLCVADVRGSVFFPPSGLAARVVAPFEPLLTRLHTPGAAFLALRADKTEAHP